MANDVQSLAHTKWNCKYHIVFAPKYRRMVFYGEKKREIGKILRQLRSPIIPWQCFFSGRVHPRVFCLYAARVGRQGNRVWRAVLRRINYCSFQGRAFLV